MDEESIENICFISFASQYPILSSWFWETDKPRWVEKRTSTALFDYGYVQQSAEQYIEEADCLFFTGGATRKLYSSLHEYGLYDQIVANINNRKYKLVAGSSAGMMILGTKTIIGHTKITEVIESLGALPGVLFDSHFSQRNRLKRLSNVVATHQLQGYGIDEYTTAVFSTESELLAVHGKHSVTHVDIDGEVTRHDSK